MTKNRFLISNLIVLCICKGKITDVDINDYNFRWLEFLRIVAVVQVWKITKTTFGLKTIKNSGINTLSFPWKIVFLVDPNIFLCPILLLISPKEWKC